MSAALASDQPPATSHQPPGTSSGTTRVLSGAVLVSLLRLQPRRILDRWTSYQNVRGMSRWHDVVDWIGGYPFEVATLDAIFDFYRARGFQLTRLKTCLGRMGCNEFVFERSRA